MRVTVEQNVDMKLQSDLRTEHCIQILEADLCGNQEFVIKIV